MNFDWLKVYQDHDQQLPILADRHLIVVDSVTGEDLGIKQPTIQHEGSYSTSIHIRISGNRITVDGNPSRINRLENLFGFTNVDQCIQVYNRILENYGLPPFTKCTKVWRIPIADSSNFRTVTDGAVIQEIHLNTNMTTGSIVREVIDPQLNLFSQVESLADTFIKAISTLPYLNSIPRLHTNGKTCDWLTKAGKGSSLIYPSVYNKAHDLATKALPQIKRKFGEESPEYQYLLEVINYCNLHGVTRFEQKFKSAFLRRHNLQHYGLSNFNRLRPFHEEFLNLHNKLQVEHMSLESITEKLIANGICENTKAANATTIYAIQWMHGQVFDLKKTQVQTHRARLRKIGIDIALPCDLSKFSLVTVKAATQITVGQLVVPSWYRRPNALALVA